MKLEDFQEFCLTFDGTSKLVPEEEEDTFIFKLLDETFAVTKKEELKTIELRCDPVKAAMLRNLYPDVRPGDHDQKRRWNKINIEGGLDDELIQEWIKDSYKIAFEALPRKKQRTLEDD